MPSIVPTTMSEPPPSSISKIGSRDAEIRPTREAAGAFVRKIDVGERLPGTIKQASIWSTVHGGGKRQGRPRVCAVRRC